MSKPIKARKYAKISVAQPAAAPTPFSQARQANATQGMTDTAAHWQKAASELARMLNRTIASGEIMADALNQSKVRAHIRQQWYENLKVAQAVIETCATKVSHEAHHLP